MFNEGDKVYLLLSKSEVKVIKELEAYNNQWHKISVRHIVGYYGKKKWWYCGNIYQLEGVKSKAGLPFWFIEEQLHRIAPKML